MSDDFSTRYRLLKCVFVEDGIRTHNAQELASGKVVMVHISDAAGPDEVESIRAQISQLQPSYLHKVLETATIASGFAVVTEFLPGALSFRSWLNRYASASQPTAAPVPTNPAIRMGSARASVASADTRETAPSTAAPVEPAAVSEAVAAVGGAGEAASMVADESGTTAANSAVEDPPTPAEAQPPHADDPAPLHLSPSRTGLADSFTAIFGAPKDPSAFVDPNVQYVDSGPPPPAPIKLSLDESIQPEPLPAWVQPPGSAPAPSLNASAPADPAPVLPPEPVAPPAPAAKAAPPGEFTMMFAPSATDKGAGFGALPGAAVPPAARAAPRPIPSGNPAPAAAPQATAIPAQAPMAAPMASPTAAPIASPLAAPMASPMGQPTVPPMSVPPNPSPAARPPVDAAPANPMPAPPPAPPQASPFGWDSAPTEAAPVSKAPPGEFTLLFGAPATAAPLPDQVRSSPMREAPPPAFSPLTPEAQLESPPVEPMHRVMSNNPSYAAGIRQEGASPIGNSLNAGGYAGQYGQTPQAPSNAAYPGGQRYGGLSDFAPAPPAPNYPPAHASPLFAKDQPLGSEANGPPGILPPPIFGNGGSTPLSALGGAAPLVNASAGPSEYTQLIAYGAAPVVPDLKPSARASAAAAAKPKGRRLPTGLIVVINAVLLIAVLLIFFVMRRQVPTVQTIVPRGPIMPNIPKAPKLDVPPR